MYKLFLAAFAVMGLAFSPVQGGINDHDGSVPSELRDNILECVQGYETAYANDDFPLLLQYYSPNGVLVSGNAAHYEGPDWAGTLGAFGVVLTNLAERGIASSDTLLVHDLESYGRSGRFVYARFILNLKDRVTGDVIETWNCTFEFVHRSIGGSGDPDTEHLSKYVVNYIHFSATSKESDAFDVTEAIVSP